MNLSTQCWRYSIWTLTWYKRLSFSFELLPKKFCIADAADLHQATLSVFAHGVWVVLHLNSAVLCKGKAGGHLQPSLKWFHGPQDSVLDIMVIMMCVNSNIILFTAVLTCQKDNQLFYCWYICIFLNRNIISAWLVCWSRPMVRWKAFPTLTVSRLSSFFACDSVIALFLFP